MWSRPLACPWRCTAYTPPPPPTRALGFNPRAWGLPTRQPGSRRIPLCPPGSHLPATHSWPHGLGPCVLATHSSVIGEQLKCLSETDGGTSRRHLQSEAQTQHEPATGTPCRLTGGLTPAPQERARTACRSPYPWSKPQQDRSPSPNLTQANQRTHSRDGLSCSPKIHTCGHPNPQNLYKRGCIWRQGL